MEEQSDPALLPENATADYRVEGGNLVWTIDRLAPGEKTQIRVQSRAKRPAERACNCAMVTTATGDRVESQAYVEIRAAAGPTLPETKLPGLALTVTDLQNPVAAGQGVTYLIRVTNPGTSPENQVILVAPIPAGTAVDPLGTSGPGSTRYTVDNGLIQFTPLAELAPKATQSYRIRVKTQRPGQIQMHVEATSRNQTRPVAADKSTKVLSSRE